MELLPTYIDKLTSYELISDRGILDEARVIIT